MMLQTNHRIACRVNAISLFALRQRVVTNHFFYAAHKLEYYVHMPHQSLAIWFRAGSACGMMMWIDHDSRPDEYAAFRGLFHMPAAGAAELRVLGASWFLLWLDGGYVLSGPARFAPAHPQYDRKELSLAAGGHVIAALVHFNGLCTRMLPDLPPFLDVSILVNNRVLPIRWKCLRLAGYRPMVRRINPVLDWIEWCDTRLNPEGWTEAGFDDSAWEAPVATDPPIGTPAPLDTGPVHLLSHTLSPIAGGPLAESYGYEFDDISARFFLRDQECARVPPGGAWRRYDLGRVRLGVPSFTLDVPRGAVVEFAYSETLAHGRVQPYITLSTGPSCNLDHYTARGGPQEFSPVTPRAV